MAIEGGDSYTTKRRKQRNALISLGVELILVVHCTTQQEAWQACAQWRSTSRETGWARGSTSLCRSHEPARRCAFAVCVEGSLTVTLEVELIDEACRACGEHPWQHRILGVLNVHLDDDVVLELHILGEPRRKVDGGHLHRLLHLGVGLPAGALLDNMRRRLAISVRGSCVRARASHGVSHMDNAREMHAGIAACVPKVERLVTHPDRVVMKVHIGPLLLPSFSHASVRVKGVLRPR